MKRKRSYVTMYFLFVHEIDFRPIGIIVTALSITVLIDT